MGAVLLFDVCLHGDMFRTDCTPVTQQVSGGRLDDAFVRNMRDDEPFNAKDIELGDQSDGECFAIGRCQDLSPSGHGNGF